MGSIVIKRKDSLISNFSKGNHRSRVYIDGINVGSLKEGETGRYPVAAGIHKVKVGTIFSRNQAITMTKENKHFIFGSSLVVDIICFLIVVGLIVTSFIIKNEMIQIVSLVVVIIILILRIRYLYNLKEIKENEK